jgi:hypothetical protein
MSKITPFSALRIIPRDSSFLDRRSGSRGEIFFDQNSNTLRLFDSATLGGIALAKSDLSNIPNQTFLAKAQSAGITGGSGNTTVSVGTSIPNNPSNGNLWLNTNNGILYVYIDDGDSNQWIQPAVPTTEFQLSISDDDDVVRSIVSGDTIQFLGNGIVTTEIDVNGNLTITGALPSNLTGLEGIQLVRGVPIAEFSSDATLSDASNDTVPTEAAVKTYVDTALSSFSGVGNFTLANSVIDTDDSSAITFTPAVIFNSDITVENDIFVSNNVLASEGIQTPRISSTGIITINSSSGILLDGLATFSRSTEIVNNKSGSTGTVIHDFSTGSLFFHSSVSANFTANFTNVPVIDDRSISVALILDQGSTPYIPNAVEINSVSETIRWSGGTPPSGTANYIDIVNFTLIRSGATWTVLGSLSTYN